jgi:hypothetical protein
VGIDDCPQGQQHALLVVADRMGGSADEDDLPAVTVDIGAEKRHAVPFGRPLHQGDELVQPETRDFWVFPQDRVEPVEANERHGHPAMFRIDGAAKQVLPQSGRDAFHEIADACSGRHGHVALEAAGRTAKKDT